MYESIPASLPQEFFYNLSKLQGSMSKNLLKVTADRTTASPGNITNFRLPIGSLIDLRSLSVWWKTKLSGTNPTIPGRYSSSFIKRISISANNVVIQQIEDYNLLYNIMADHTNKSHTKGLAGEFLDNTIIWSESTPTGSDQVAISGANSLLAATANQTAIPMHVNNFLGVLGSSSTPIVPTDRFGEIVISIQWDQPYAMLGGTAEASAATYSNNSYELSDLYLSVEALSFSDDSYYTSIGSKDLQYYFNDYIVTRFAECTKTTGINVTTYLNANSLDWVGCTAIRNQTAPSTMVGYGGNGDGATANVVNVYKYLSDPVTYVNNNGSSPVSGDGFFNTEYFVRDLQGIDSVQFSINNKSLNYAALNKYETFQNNLCALGYEGVDASKNSLIDTCVSIFHYFKYYGMAMQSLELVDKDQFYISGLSSAGSSCAVNASIKFAGNASYNITPILIAKMSKVLHCKAGRMISVE